MFEVTKIATHCLVNSYELIAREWDIILEWYGSILFHDILMDAKS